MAEKVHISGLNHPLTIACVLITRDRPHLLRQTLASLGRSLYPLQAVIVSDDSTEEATAQMLMAEFPEVTRLEGPRRGRAANRNHAIHAAKADCILVSDDDMLIDPEFCRTALEKVSQDGCSLVFPSMREDEHVFMPNALDFLGFLTKAYASKVPYHTAHSGCFLLSKAVAEQVTYDETIESYGYEEVDFIYRVASAAFRIGSVPECVCTHLAPHRTHFPPEEANRLYGAFKRHYYVDKHPWKGIAFLCLAIPHHFLSSFKREGWKGLSDAWSNMQRFLDMLRRARRSGALQQSRIHVANPTLLRS